MWMQDQGLKSMQRFSMIGETASTVQSQLILFDTFNFACQVREQLLCTCLHFIHTITSLHLHSAHCVYIYMYMYIGTYTYMIYASSCIQRNPNVSVWCRQHDICTHVHAHACTCCVYIHVHLSQWTPFHFFGTIN